MNKVKLFLLKEGVKLSKAGKYLIDRGWELMKNSKDDTHDERHVVRIMADLKKLLGEEKGLKKKVDMESVILAILWHDVWKARRNPDNVFWLTWGNYYEGWGSKKMFEKEAEMAGMKKKKIEKIAEAIKKHPWFWKKAEREMESKVLWDLDNLDIWSMKRLVPKKDYFLSKIWRKRDRLLMRAVFFYVQNFLMKRKEKYLFFSWSRMEMVKRKEIFGKEFGKIWREYRKKLMGRKKRKIIELKLFSRG